MRELDLASNEFGDNGAICLATCVHKIETLKIRSCDIGSRGIEALVQSIRKINHQVKILNIKPYENIKVV